jgi:hypothetical protein
VLQGIDLSRCIQVPAKFMWALCSEISATISVYCFAGYMCLQPLQLKNYLHCTFLCYVTFAAGKCRPIRLQHFDKKISGENHSAHLELNESQIKMDVRVRTYGQNSISSGYDPNRWFLWIIIIIIINGATAQSRALASLTGFVTVRHIAMWVIIPTISLFQSSWFNHQRHLVVEPP